MKNKKIHFWIYLFAITLAVSAGAASFAARENKIYKGISEFQAGQAAVLKAANETQKLPSDFSSIIQANENRLPKPIKNEPKREEKKKNTPIIKQSTPTCPAGAIPRIRNGSVVGCKNS